MKSVKICTLTPFLPPMRVDLEAGRAKGPAFLLARDGVHPGREGHWIMAREILTQCFGAKLDGIDKAEDLFARNGDEICQDLHPDPISR